MTVSQAHNTTEGSKIVYGKSGLIVSFVKTSRSGTKATYIVARKENGELVEARCRHFKAL